MQCLKSNLCPNSKARPSSLYIPQEEEHFHIKDGGGGEGRFDEGGMEGDDRA